MHSGVRLRDGDGLLVGADAPLCVSAREQDELRALTRQQAARVIVGAAYPLSHQAVPANVPMHTIRFFAAGLAVCFCLNVARASDPEQTGSIDRPLTTGMALNVTSTDPAVAGDGKAMAVILPELSVTDYAPVHRPLPRLKPLPKWDPHVCIGC